MAESLQMVDGTGLKSSVEGTLGTMTTEGLKMERRRGRHDQIVSSRTGVCNGKEGGAGRVGRGHRYGLSL